MKKILLPVFIILLSSFTLKSYSQIAYYDAEKLKEYMINDTTKVIDTNGVSHAKGWHFKKDSINYYAVLDILSKYTINTKTRQEVFTIFSTNPFIKQYLPGPPASTQPLSNTSGNLFAAAGNLDVTNFADGIAQFLIERGKEELDIAFIDKFKVFLSKCPEANISFPTTIGFINNVESYNYPAMMPALRAAFQKDFNMLSENLIKLRDIKSDTTYTNALANKKQTKADQALIIRVEAISSFLNNTVAGRAVIGALTISDGIAKGTNAADVIDNLSVDPAFKDGTPAIPKGDILANSVQFINLLSQSLRSTDDGRIWVTKKQISDLLKDDVTLNLYLGLLYAQNHNNAHITFTIKAKGKPDQTLKFEDFLTQLKKDLDIAGEAKSIFKQKFMNAAYAASDASDNVKNIAALQKQNDQSGILLYANYASSISTFLKNSISLIPDNLKDTSHANAIKNDITGFTSVIDNLVNSCYYIKSQNYSALVLSTSAIFTQIIAYNPDTSKLSKNDILKYKASALQFRDDYIKYGTFMASILEAKSSADVKAAIEVVALPAGSYSIKQKSEWNISLNGYIGYGVDIDFAHGVYAPIGFSATWGSKNSAFLKSIPVTIFVSLIDVGSIVSYRLNDASTDKLKQEVRLESIISPSVQAIFEIPKTPIGVAAGWRRTPKLFYSDDSTFAVKDPKGVFNVSLLIDIPIFTLHNKPF